MTHLKTLDDCTLSAAAIADLFDVTPEMIRLHVNKNGMPRVSRGKYSLRDCIHWHINRLQQKAEINDSSDIQEEKLKLVRAQRQRVELENKKRRSELLDTEFVRTLYNQAAAIYASQLDGLGARIAAIVAGMDDTSEIQRVLFNECRAIRESTAAEFISVAYEYDGGDDTATATIEGRRKVG